MPQVIDLVLHALDGQSIVDLLNQLMQAERLLDKVLGTVLHGHHGGVHRCIAGHDEHDRGLVYRLYPLEELDAVYSRQLEVGEHDIINVLVHPHKRRFGVFHEFDLVVVPLQLLEDHLA